jgi:hypothetical protein
MKATKKAKPQREFIYEVTPRTINRVVASWRKARPQLRKEGVQVLLRLN